MTRFHAVLDRTDDPTREPPRMVHRYSHSPKYRLSGMEPPQIGDIALCGHRKAEPPRSPAAMKGMHRCVVCVDLHAQGMGR